MEISTMRISDGKGQKREKQRLWLKRPMTARLVFHGKNSERKMVILEGRAPAQGIEELLIIICTRIRKNLFSIMTLDLERRKTGLAW